MVYFSYVKLSIIIPAHNEVVRLPAVLEDYVRYFVDRMRDAFELVIVANHCSDSTAAAARSIAADHPQVRVIEEERRIGKGGAIIMGAKAARGEWIGFVDADGATAPAEFARLFEVAQKADGVIGSRWLQGARVVIHQKWLRLLSSRVFNLFIRLLLGLNYQDTQCGAKIFKAEAWRKILPNIGITRFAFDVDLLFQLRREKFNIIEEPTEWHDVAGSKVNILGSSLEMFLAIVRMRLLYSPLKPLVKLYERTIAKPVEFLLKDPLFRHTVLLSAAAMVTHICNILFQMIVGRRLPAAEYTLLATFLALFAIVGRPFGTLSTAMNHYTSILIQKGKHVLIGRLLTKWGIITGVPSIILALICVGFASEIAGFFHLERAEPVIVAALALPAVFVSPVFSGTIAGMQHFGITALVGSVGAIFRVLFGGLFVYIVFAASGWALAGHVAGMYGSMFIMLFVLMPFLFQRNKDAESIPSMRVYLFWTFFVHLASAFLMTGDVVLVRHFLPVETDFAYAATLGRITVFLAVSVVHAMFPKVSSTGKLTRGEKAVYLRSLLYSSGFVALGLFFCFAMPGLLLRFFFGLTDVSRQTIMVTRWMATVMACSTLLTINKTFLLAQRRFLLLFSLALCAGVYLLSAILWHTSIWAIIIASGVSNLLALVVTTVGILRTPTVKE